MVPPVDEPVDVPPDVPELPVLPPPLLLVPPLVPLPLCPPVEPPLEVVLVDVVLPQATSPTTQTAQSAKSFIAAMSSPYCAVSNTVRYWSPGEGQVSSRLARTRSA